MGKSWGKALGLGLGLGLMAIGCGGARAGGVGAVAPAAFVSTADGRGLAFEDLRGKVVVVGFFASWCAPSREAVRALDRFQQQGKNSDLVVIALDVEEDRDTMKRFVDAEGPSIPVALDFDGTIAKGFGIQSIPSLAIVDRRGVVQYVHDGYRAKNEILEIAEKSAALLLDLGPVETPRVPPRPFYELARQP